MSARYWAVVPAAGVGKRMRANLPKQYLLLGDRTVLDMTLDRLLAQNRIEGIIIALSAQDHWWSASQHRRDARIIAVEGGQERCHSVLNALGRLSDMADAHDWVLVHDAARPCVRQADMDKLINQLGDHPVGGLLGVPVRDTMKRTDGQGRVCTAVERQHLWHAFTPQMFRFGVSRHALTEALNRQKWVTDESSALEMAGYSPQLVEGHADNLKITRAEDLALAAFYLHQQTRALS
jgi:2-C-methyl-D-erythritol 4-phosphate cytidylyltransferase